MPTPPSVLTCPQCRFDNSTRAERCALCQTPLIDASLMAPPRPQRRPSEALRRQPPPLPPRRRRGGHAPPPPPSSRRPYRRQTLTQQPPPRAPDEDVDTRRLRPRPAELAAPGARDLEPDTRRVLGVDPAEPDTRDFIEDEPDTKDVDEVELPDRNDRHGPAHPLLEIPPELVNLEPDTLGHDEEILDDAPPTLTVDTSGGFGTGLTRSGPATAAGTDASDRSGSAESLLGELPTMPYDPEVIQQAARDAAAEAKLEREQQERPAWRDFNWQRLDPRLRLAILGGLLVLTLGLGLVLDAYLDEKAALRRDAEQLDYAIAQVLTASAIPLHNEATLISRLRRELRTLGKSLGPDHQALAPARGKIELLEGLLAIQSGNLARARAAAASPDVQATQSVGRLALDGGIAAFGSGSNALGQLNKALERGFDRPEVRAWRARARLLDLDETSGAVAAELLLARLQDLEALQALDPELLLRRVRALITLERWSKARAAVEALPQPPADLVQRIRLGVLEQVVRDETVERALAKVNSEPLPASPAQLRPIGHRALQRANGLLLTLRGGSPLADTDQRGLLRLLQLAHRLGWKPLPANVLTTLTLALPLDESKPLSGPLILALGTLGTRDARRQALVFLAKHLERESVPDKRLRLRLLQGAIVTADLDQGLAPERLLYPLNPAQRHELAWAAIKAKLERGEARAALLAAEDALADHPGSADLEALREEAIAALAAKRTPPDKPELPKGPRRRVP